MHYKTARAVIPGQTSRLSSSVTVASTASLFDTSFIYSRNLQQFVAEGFRTRHDILYLIVFEGFSFGDFVFESVQAFGI